ncbi:MAG: phage portal protein, partial [Mycobacterium sp.]
MAKSRHVDLPAPTIADRFINWFDPVAGTKRAHARALQALSGAYVGASRSRRALKAWNPLAGDADADSLDDLPTLRERSRDARRNIPIAAGAISTNTQNVVGGGLTLQSTIDADRLGMSDDQAAEWEATTEQEFRFWADSPDSDAARTLPFGEQQELAFGSVLENGDAFALLASIERPRSPYRLAV